MKKLFVQILFMMLFMIPTIILPSYLCETEVQRIHIPTIILPSYLCETEVQRIRREANKKRVDALKAGDPKDLKLAAKRHSKTAPKRKLPGYSPNTSGLTTLSSPDRSSISSPQDEGELDITQSDESMIWRCIKEINQLSTTSIPFSPTRSKEPVISGSPFRKKQAEKLARITAANQKWTQGPLTIDTNRSPQSPSKVAFSPDVRNIAFSPGVRVSKSLESDSQFIDPTVNIETIFPRKTPSPSFSPSRATRYRYADVNVIED